MYVGRALYLLSYFAYHYVFKCAGESSGSRGDLGKSPWKLVVGLVDLFSNKFIPLNHALKHLYTPSEWCK